MTTEAVNAESEDLDRLTPLEAARLMNRMDGDVVRAVEATLLQIAEAVERIGVALRSGGRLFYVGAGTSGRLGVLDASECPPTFGTEPSQVQGIIAGGEAALRNPVEGAEDDGPAGAAEMDEYEVGANDVVVGISASGSAPYVRHARHRARERGATTVGVSNNRPAALEAEAEIAILAVTGPEILSASTRLKAGTAQKMILNMLSTLGMVQAGKTYGNLMVDLQPTNNKLRNRAVRITRRVCNCDEATAIQALQESGWRVKVALVMLKAGVSSSCAEELLDRGEGFVRQTLDQT